MAKLPKELFVATEPRVRKRDVIHHIHNQKALMWRSLRSVHRQAAKGGLAPHLCEDSEILKKNTRSFGKILPSSPSQKILRPAYGSLKDAGAED